MQEICYKLAIQPQSYDHYYQRRKYAFLNESISSFKLAFLTKCQKFFKESPVQPFCICIRKNSQKSTMYDKMVLKRNRPLVKTVKLNQNILKFGYQKGESCVKSQELLVMTMTMMTKINCFCRVVDQRKWLTLTSSRDQ